MGYPETYPGGGASGIKGQARMETALPSWMGLDRGPGSWSRQTAAAVDGTTFLELGTSQNTPRFDYDPTSGRTMLLIEPTRTNVATNTNFVDVAPADGTPDAWAINAGVTAVDFSCPAAGPHGGVRFRLEDTAVATRGVFTGGGLAALTQYTAAVWARRTGAGAASLIAFQKAPGNALFTLPAVAHDWTRVSVTDTTVGAGGVGFMAVNGDPAGVIDEALLMLEAGECESSYTSATRAAELCAVDSAVVGRTSGYVSFLWRPDYASTTALTVSPVLFAWAPNWELYFDPADDKLKLTVDSAAGAESAALTFARQAIYHIGVRYGSAGTQLSVNGTVTTDASAWGTPALAPYLGSRAASVNCRPSAYGNFLSTSV